MKGKILLVAGLGIGYVLGSRAGRERYEQIKRATDKFWNKPAVRERRDQAEDFVKDKAPEVAEFLADGAKKAVAAVAGSKAPKRSSAKKPDNSASNSSASSSSTSN